MLRKRHAFTLIELLVVIAIIAILAAILFPVFAAAKQSAKKAADLSNMKQIGTAITMYSSDNEDTYPLMYQGDYVNWPANVRLWSSTEVIGPYSKNTDLLKCPIDSAKQSHDAAYYYLPTSRPPKELSYLPNSIADFNGSTAWGIAKPKGVFGMPYDDFGWWAISGVTTTTEVKAPSSVIMLANGAVEYYSPGAYGCLEWLNNEIDWCTDFRGVYGDWLPTGIRLATPTSPSSFWKTMYPSWRKFNGGANFVMTDTSAKFLKPDAVDKAERWLVNN